jgi:hypothetical protein
MNNFKWYKFLVETKEATDPILREIYPNMEQYSQIVLDSIVDKEYFYVKMGGNSRNGLVLDTKKGRIPFYRSSGKSEASKQEGEWTIFKGYQPFNENFAHIRKTVRTFNLTQGGDKYLTTLCLVLGYLWDQKQLINQLQRVDIYQIANQRLNQINEKIKQLNQQEDRYMDYNMEELQGAYLNSYLQDKDALSSVVWDGYIPDQNYVGLKEIRSEQLTEFQVQNKMLPTLEDVVG